MHGATERTSSQGYAKVLSIADLEYFVKESELYTGKPGRTFQVRSGDRLRYRVQLQDFDVFEIERLSEAGRPLSSTYVCKADIGRHCLGAAMTTGFLYAEVTSQ